MKFATAFFATISLAAVAVNALSLPLFGERAIAARMLPAKPKSLHRRVDAGNNTASYNAMINAYTSGTGQAAIQADIAALTNTSLAIDAAFTSVAVKLKAIDALGFGAPFSPQWAALQQEYINILWSSRTSAAQLSAYCQDFESTILPISLGSFPGQPPLTQAQVISILQGFQSDAGTFETQAQSTSDAFRQLIQDLAVFTGSFETFALAQKITDQAQIDALNIEIAQLQKTISQLDNQIADLAAAVGITVFATIVGVALFPEFAPFIIGAGVVAVAGEATAWGILSAERDGAIKKLANDRVNITTLTNELATIANANSTLVDIKNNTVPDMQSKLGSFKGIWDAVATDINQVIEYISLAQGSANSSVFIPFIVYAHLENANSVYAPLGNALVSYSNGIASSGIPQPTVNNKVVLSTSKIVPLTTGPAVEYFSPTVAKVKTLVANYQKSLGNVKATQ